VVEIVKSCRENGTDTPFLSKVLNSQDGFLGRALTDSELAEECMGGMYVLSICITKLSHELTEIGLEEAEQQPRPLSIYYGLSYDDRTSVRSCRTN
jgi:hypothetical protein